LKTSLDKLGMRARIGQKNGQVRQWARRGTRPRQPADQRYDNAYLFGAICPARGVGAALALPYADTDMMQLHLDEISRNVTEGGARCPAARSRRIAYEGKLDVPENITPIFLPSRAPGREPLAVSTPDLAADDDHRSGIREAGQALNCCISPLSGQRKCKVVHAAENLSRTLRVICWV
jgi:hypothetical protein